MRSRLGNPVSPTWLATLVSKTRRLRNPFRPARVAVQSWSGRPAPARSPASLVAPRSSDGADSGRNHRLSVHPAARLHTPRPRQRGCRHRPRLALGPRRRRGRIRSPLRRLLPQLDRQHPPWSDVRLGLGPAGCRGRIQPWSLGGLLDRPHSRPRFRRVPHRPSPLRRFDPRARFPPRPSGTPVRSPPLRPSQLRLRPHARPVPRLCTGYFPGNAPFERRHRPHELLPCRGLAAAGRAAVPLVTGGHLHSPSSGGLAPAALFSACSFEGLLI